VNLGGTLCYLTVNILNHRLIPHGVQEMGVSSLFNWVPIFTQSGLQYIHSWDSPEHPGILRDGRDRISDPCILSCV